MRRSPTGTYSLELPDNIREEVDGRVSSFRIDGEPLLLQLSSYQRLDGPAVSAQVRLQERMQKQGGPWWPIPLDSLPIADAEKAGAQQIVGDMLWMHIYLVWPHLTVYLTLSGPSEHVLDHSTWARTALNSFSLVIQ